MKWLARLEAKADTLEQQAASLRQAVALIQVELANGAVARHPATIRKAIKLRASQNGNTKVSDAKIRATMHLGAKKAAEQLGVSDRTVYTRREQLGLKPAAGGTRSLKHPGGTGFSWAVASVLKEHGGWMGREELRAAMQAKGYKDLLGLGISKRLGYIKAKGQGQRKSFAFAAMPVQSTGSPETPA